MRISIQVFFCGEGYQMIDCVQLEWNQTLRNSMHAMMMTSSMPNVQAKTR
jgi:hypothetical protein